MSSNFLVVSTSKSSVAIENKTVGKPKQIQIEKQRKVKNS